MRRLQLVVNPAAGGGRGAAVVPGIEAALRSAGHDVVITPTRSLAHADELVAGAVADERVAVAVGGDGIVGRVAGAAAEHDAVIGVLPGGRGNDFARSVGIPRDPVAACEVLSGGRERRIDLGVAGGVPFVGIASVGFDSTVQERVLTSRLPLGELVYLYGALATVASWRHATFACTVDGRPLVVRGWSVAVANSGTYGGGMRLAPDASIEDGLLDVVTSAATSRRRFLRDLPRVFSGTHVDLPSVSVLRARVVSLACDRPMRVFADGDPVATLPCEVSVRPGALRCVLPVDSSE